MDMIGVIVLPVGIIARRSGVPPVGIIVPEDLTGSILHPNRAGEGFNDGLQGYQGYKRKKNIKAAGMKIACICTNVVYEKKTF
jgi:hypothetical protein